MAHSVSSAPGTSSAARPTGNEEPSVGTLVQSAMADMSTLIRNEIELAKAEIGTSAKKGAIGGGMFAAAGVLAAFAGVFFFITVAEFLTWLGLERWISYLIVFVLIIALAVVVALIGKRMISKIEKPERTMETLSDLPDVLHREAPGQRHRAVPEVSNGQVRLQGTSNYSV